MCVTSIAVLNDEFDTKAVSMLEKLQIEEYNSDQSLKRRPFSAIHLISLKMSFQARKKLLEVLANFENIEKLTLRNISLSAQPTLEALQRFVDRSYTLQYLDISNASLKSKQLVRLSGFLSTNKQLSTLSLADNIVDHILPPQKPVQSKNADEYDSEKS